MSAIPCVSQEQQDLFFANMVKFLIDGQEVSAAKALLSCSMEINYLNSYDDEGINPYGYEVILKAPRFAYDILDDEENLDSQAIYRAIYAVLKDRFSRTPDVRVTAGGSFTGELSPGWREKLHEMIALGGDISNQGVGAERSDHFKIWNGIKFRSETERRVAQALDNCGVLYLPNCLARLGKPSDRKNKEPDFLVCVDGKWGILEVDGEPYHTGLAARDHERDRQFRTYGILVIERFDATECFERPMEIVKQFLQILHKA